MSQYEIVVGVNGSPSSLRAVELAGAEAARRGLPVVLVHTWQTYPQYEGALLFPPEDVERAEGQILTDASAHLARVAPGVDVRTRLVQERADVALVEASRTAALLFLGCHKGSAAWTGPVLGHVTARAHCPVVAVPPTAVVEPGDVVVGVDGSAVCAEAVAFARPDRALGHASTGRAGRGAHVRRLRRESRGARGAASAGACTWPSRSPASATATPTSRCSARPGCPTPCRRWSRRHRAPVCSSSAATATGRCCGWPWAR